MKRGQAALEFLLSYGWAMLTVMVVIGSIAYIVPNSGSLTRNKCAFPPQMTCAGTRLTNESLTMSLRNSGGVGINSVVVKLISPQAVNCTIPKTNFKPDEQFIVTCDNAGTMNINSNTKFIVSVTYLKSQGSYNQTLTGEAYAKLIG